MRDFGSVKERETRFRAMIGKYRTHEKIVDAQDIDDLRTLHRTLGCPPNASPSEVLHYFVAPGKFGKRIFQGKLRDGTTVTIPYSRNSHSKKVSGNRASEAFRLHVANDRKAFRNKLRADLRGIVCKHCGCAVTAATIQADHHPRSFVDILTSFLSMRGVSLDDIEVRDDGEGMVGLVDLQLGRDWRTFHTAHAQFVPSCRSCNQRKSRL